MVIKFPNPLKGVLFDYDGVIADTMTDNFHAWQKALKTYGVALQEDDYYPLEGMNTISIAKHIVNQYHLSESIALSIVDAKEDNYRKNNNFRIYPYIYKLISLLKKNGIKLALITGASKLRVMNITSSEVMSNFDVVVTGEMVKYPKPDPQPYLIGLDRLHIKPEQGLAVENAPLGIQSAKFAGLYCIALCTTLNKSKLNGADLILESGDFLINRLMQRYGKPPRIFL